MFSDGYLCSQSVLGAFAEEYKLPIWLALQLGTCFGAGMRKGEVCGACTGALMVLGLMHSDPKDRMDACRNSDRFLDAFQKRFLILTARLLTDFQRMTGLLWKALSKSWSK